MGLRAWWSQTFVNDGGPLIVLPHELVGHWPGTRNDYDRACDARSPFDFFPAGPGLIVVMTSPDTMIYEASWLRLPGQPGITLVGWDTGAEDERTWLLARLACPGIRWHRHRPRMTVSSGVLLLQHAAGPAADVRLVPAEDNAYIGQVVPVGIEPGRYAFETATVDEEVAQDRYCCVLCRWVPSRRAQPGALRKRTTR
jgi:hypothetical protein